MSAHYSSEEHGGFNAEELDRLGIPEDRILDFSVNSNPFGPSPGVLKTIQRVDISKYPDRQNHRLKTALAEANETTPDHLMIGNGTSELIWLVVKAFCRPGDQVISLGPTFGEYKRAADAHGIRTDEVRAEPPNFEFPAAKLIDRIKNEHPRLVFVCNPNNPTGIYLQAGQVVDIKAACGGQTILVLDEAYRAFMDGVFFSRPLMENSITLRSMTKDFALAGLRLGYAAGDPDLIKKLTSYQPAWSVNAFAQAAGLAVMGELDYYKDTITALKEVRNRFFRQLMPADSLLWRSDVHFGLIPLGQPGAEVRGLLLKHFIQVRDCASFGLPCYIRISTQKEETNRVFLDLFNRLREEGEIKIRL